MPDYGTLGFNILAAIAQVIAGGAEAPR